VGAVRFRDRTAFGRLSLSASGPADERHLIQALIAFSGPDVLVGHNVGYDLRVVNDRAAFRHVPFRLPGIAYCTLQMARKALDRQDLPEESYQLGYVAEALGIPVERDRLHTALYDAELAWRVYCEVRGGRTAVSVRRLLGGAQAAGA